ncbi:MAG TPA: aminoglycoside phosphotransferase family protein [Casimicrobiaceae bacterium]|nr:aminoglycoside phosphotransferase family protein [Casimicrobiaceae bacterium]
MTIAWNAFGPSLEHLIRAQPAALRDAATISPLVSSESRRAAFRLRFRDGRTLKGRRLETAQQAETVWRLSQLHLRSEPVARVVARRSEALLEEWVLGQAIAAPDAETLRSAGALLGRLHRIDGPGFHVKRVVDQRFVEESLDAGRLVRANLLGQATAREAVALARASAPIDAEWGLCHGDFCAENLLRVPERGLHVVDNETICELWYDCDLARTWYRWPMNASAFATFLDGYRLHREPREFIAHFRFWAICVLLRSAMFRQRNAVSTESPLARLKSMLRKPSPPWTTR